MDRRAALSLYTQIEAMARSKGNILLEKLSGAIGRQVVIKQYASGVVVSKYPDMSGILPSPAQQERRKRFGEAVAFARSVNNDLEQKAAWKQKIRAGDSIYQAALKAFLAGEV